MGKQTKKEAKKPGPEEVRLKLEGAWESNVSKALTKKRPGKAWPKEEKPKKAE